MSSKRIFLFALLFPLFPISLMADQNDATWLRTRVANALNPKISVIPDLVFQSGPGRSNEFSLREVEIAFQSNVDPNTRLDVYLAKPDDENLEIEEAYITILSLPGAFQLRGGKLLANFGRLNIIHQHELPQTDRPLALDSYLGHEGINDVGGEISRIFDLGGIFTETSYAFLNSLGEEHHETETTTVTDTNGNTVTVAIHSEDEESNQGLRDFGHVGRLRFNKDLSSETNLELGFSGALHQPESQEQKRLGGVDLTARWRPLREGLSKSFIWRSEALYSHRSIPTTAGPKTKLERYGGYSYVEIQPHRQWAIGTRGDYLEDPESTTLIVTRAVTPYITFYLNEFNRYRAQYQYKDISGMKDEHIGWLQWTVIIGPHGAHPY